jgi:hypothetical protein
MASTFDTLFPTELNGVVAKFEIVDPDGTPNRVLEITRSWSINIEWHLTGTGVTSLGGTWHVRVSLESMGPGFEGVVDPIVDVPYGDYDPAMSGPTHCHWKLPQPITITPAEMQARNITPNVYKPVVLITYTNPVGQRQPMAGFWEGNLITLYDPN